MNRWCAISILLSAMAAYAQGGPASPPASATQAMYHAAAESARRKFQYIEQNGARLHPDQSPTQLTEREINAYFAAGYVKLPKGVQRLQVSGAQGIVTGTARVDFDQVTAGSRAANPLLSIFSGIHDVEVTAHAGGSGHQGHVHIDSAAIGGVPIPRIALQYFVEKYVTPKYPNVGMDSSFALPHRIDLAIIGQHVLTVTQK
jgi:hypothetical protein